MTTMTIENFPPLEGAAIDIIRTKFLLSENELNEEISHTVYDGNDQGYYCYFVYKDYDPRNLDFRSIPRENVREFTAIYSSGSTSPLGLRIVFVSGVPIFSEGYSLGNDIPEDLSNFEFSDIYEEQR
jgi:hypothetical protein